VTVTDGPHVAQQIVAIRRRDQGRPSGPVAAFLTLLGEVDLTLSA
jgi:hypothetical protein